MDKQTLNNYRAMALELEQLEELIARVQARITEPKVQKLSQTPKGGGGAGDAISANIARLESLLDMYNKRWDDAIAARADIEAAIDGLEPTERMLIRYRYIEGLSWEDVAGRMGYGLRHTFRIHGEILKKMS